jgi:hypothetical protein
MDAFSDFVDGIIGTVQHAHVQNVQKCDLALGYLREYARSIPRGEILIVLSRMDNKRCPTKSVSCVIHWHFCASCYLVLAGDDICLMNAGDIHDCIKGHD